MAQVHVALADSIAIIYDFVAKMLAVYIPVVGNHASFYAGLTATTTVTSNLER